MAWRPVARYESLAALLRQAALEGSTGARLHDALAGRPAVVELGGAAAPASGAALLQRIAGATVELRPPRAVARSGGAFHAPGAERPTVAQWLRGAGAALVFDTRRGSELQRALRAELGAGPPAELREWSRSPIATLGRPQEEGQAAGLAFHRHERNWLLLVTGRKRWYFRASADMAASPATALTRVSEEQLRTREPMCAPAGTELLTHDQRPGEALLLPDGLWHCTYNLPAGGDGGDGVVVGYGGMGACASEAHYFAAAGDLAGLESAAPSAEEAGALAHAAAEQAQLSVLEWLRARFGEEALRAANEHGATPLHTAAAAGDAACVELLLAAGAGVGAADVHGTTAAHWAARSGAPAVLEALRAAGADLEAEDGHCGCRPLHLLAGEGHLEAVRWLVEAGAEAGARDRNGQSALDWAVGAGHMDVASWLCARLPETQGAQ